MADSGGSSTGMKKTLGLTGVTINAMALIAPGAFLWITYQVQAASADAAGNSTAPDMWTGIVAALIVAFLTALSFAELARRYPDAGTGSSYYFAEKVFLDREEPSHRRWARLAKFITGWAAHLFYWVYPGVMVAFFAILTQYVVQQIFPSGPINALFSNTITLIIIAIIFSVIVGAIAWRGITGSTNVAIAINVIQLVALIGFSIMAIAFRISNPLGIKPDEWYHAGATSVVFPHSLSAMLVQSTIAILILVGFESSTALGAEAINPKRDIPRGVILSLVIQGLFAYLFEYFAANYALVNSGTHALGTGLGYMLADGKTPALGISAAATSGAPIGDMIKQIGTAFFTPEVGFILMIFTAITVVIAVLGTTLAAMNTGVRISFAMAQDREMPEIMGALHDKYATPHMGIIIMVVVSAVIGSLGVAGGIVTLSAVTYASNLGTFILYALICVATMIGFAGTKEYSPLKHMIIPLLGVITNVGLAFGIFILNFQAGGVASQEVSIALAIAAGWLIVSIIFFVVNSRRRNVPIIGSVSQTVGAAGGD